jgi:hypothetical protein
MAMRHYHETPSFFDAYYFEQALAYEATRTVPEHELRAERPIPLPRVASYVAAAVVVASSILAFADLVSAEPGVTASHPSMSAAIDAANNR